MEALFGLVERVPILSEKVTFHSVTVIGELCFTCHIGKGLQVCEEKVVAGIEQVCYKYCKDD